MPRKPKNPADSPQVRSKQISAMATMALAIKSELDAIQAVIPARLDVRFEIAMVRLGNKDVFADLAGTWILSRNASKLEAKAVSRIASTVRYVLTLKEDLERHGIIEAKARRQHNSASGTMTGMATGHIVPEASSTLELSNLRVVRTVNLSEALRFLNDAIPALASAQGLAYRLSTGAPQLVNAYIGVLVHHRQANKLLGKRQRSRRTSHSSAGPHRIPISRWENMVQEFTKQPISQHYAQLSLLGRSSSRRKAAGALAHELGLIRIMSTRVVELLPKGLAHHQSCLAAINAGQPLPDPFG